MHPIRTLAGLPAVLAALAGVGLLAAASPARALDFYVDATLGDDRRGPVEALSPATPWATIDHALRHTPSGHSVRVRPGTYPESAGSASDGVSLVADEGYGTVFVEPAAGQSGIDVRHRDFVVDGIIVRGGSTGLRAEAADGLRVERSAFVAQGGTGVRVVQSAAVHLDGVIVTSAGQSGIELELSSPALIRNGLVYQNSGWGIVVEGDASPATTIDTTIAFSTVAYNGGASGGGVFVRDVAVDLHDNVVAFNAPTGLRLVAAAGSRVRHSDVFGSPQPVLPEATVLGEGMLSADPAFVLPAGPDGVLGGADGFLDDDFSLQQVAASDPVESPAVDAGSVLAAAGGGIGGSTRRDGGSDEGVADLGYHRGAPAADGIPVGSTPSPTPAPGQGAVHYVDCAAGDDGRSKLEARDATTPWRTMQRAAQGLAYGEVAVVKAGTCAERVETNSAGLTFVAETPGSVVVAPPAGFIGFNVQHDDVTIDGFVVRSIQQGVLGAKSKAGEVLENLVLRNLVVEPPVGGTILTNGIHVRNARFVTIENSVVRGAEQMGIKLLRVNDAYVRNNLVTGAGDWGISIDGDSPNRHAPATGNVAAFNTVWGNLRGLRFRNAYGEVRDNIAAANALVGIKYDLDDAGWMVHHNAASGSTTNFSLKSGNKLHASNLSVDPGLVAPESGNFALRQVAGEAPVSALVDAGSGPVASVDIDGTTRTDAAPDTGIADMGYHAGATASPSEPGGPGPALPPGPTPSPSPTPVLTPSPTPAPGQGAVHYVDCAAGDDGRSKLEARDATTPWRTMQRAAQGLAYGEVAVVKAGTCAERVETNSAGLTFVAETPGSVVVAPPAGFMGFNVQHDDVTIDGFVVRSTQQGVLGAKSKAGEVLENLVLRNLVVEPPVGGTILTNGIHVRDARFVTIENSVVRGAEQMGIKLLRVNDAYVRNNLVTGANDWGISIDGDSPNRHAPATGNVAAFNTVWGNLRGLRFRNAYGEVRDNIAAANQVVGIKYDLDDAGWMVHHNAASGSTTNFSLKSGNKLHASNLSVDPGLVAPESGNFALRQVAGEAPVSPLVDAGSGPVIEVDIDGTTRTDAAPDTGIADMGYHGGATPSASAPGGPGPVPAPTATPAPTPTPVPTPYHAPEPGSGPTYYVDPVDGDDSRSNGDALSPDSAWKSLPRAINAASPGDTIVLRAGVYHAQADFKHDSITLVGEGPLGEVVIVPPPGQVGVYVDGYANARVRNLVVQGAAQGIVANGAPNLLLSGVVVVSSASNGIVVKDSPEVWIENTIVTGSGAMGIKLKQSGPAYIRNNLVYGSADWGISLDNETKKARPPLAGNVVAFNTVHGNRSGVRLLNMSGEVRDNTITGQTDVGLYLAAPDVTVHHNNFSSNGRDRDQKNDFLASLAFWANLGVNPRYVNPAGADGILGGDGWLDDDFRLQQLAAGDAQQSPLIDAGSGAVGALDIGGSTARDGTPDAGIADIGYHDAAPPGVAVPAPMPIGDNLQRTFFVSATLGDDSRKNAAARKPESPWRTIARAMQRVLPGDTVVVLPGTYAETVQVKVADVAVLAESPGTVVLAPPSGNGITIEAPGVTVDGFVIEGGATGISVLDAAPRARIRNCAVVGALTDGIRAVRLDDVIIESSVVTGAGGSGIRLKRVGSAAVRNNLVYANGEWGVSFDASNAQSIVSTGNLIAHNTLYANQVGNVAFMNALGEIRDNLLAATPGRALRLGLPGVLLRHNGFSANGSAIDPPSYIFSCAGCTENRPLEPRFVAPAGPDGVLGGAGWRDDDFRLRSAGDGGAVSAAIDAGSGPVAALDIDGTTATSGLPDDGTADLGFHYADSPRALPLPGGSPL